MFHSPIQIKKISLSFAQKTCFENFSATVNFGDKIAIIGRNGSGKSSLLKILQGNLEPTEGSTNLPDGIIRGYVPQVIYNFNSCSGGQRLNKSLSQALSDSPDMLLLDEPTNHLDLRNRKSLMRMLKNYNGTLIVVSHDVELLRNCIDTFWHIDNGRISTFRGNYDDYTRDIAIKRSAIEQKLANLDRKNKEIQNALAQEQQRAAKSKAKGKKNVETRRWISSVANGKANSAEKTSGKKFSAIENQKQELLGMLSNLKLPEIIEPKFSLTSSKTGNYNILSIIDGAINYAGGKTLIYGINFSIFSKEKIAIIGDNGSGKSTLLKAILNDQQVVKFGEWSSPKINDIGYLDQHYKTLNPSDTVIESLEKSAGNWSQNELRRHLNSFLFRKNEEINCKVADLSGGENARLSLAKIAAKPPKLLILDEITNNLDLETCEHITQILKHFDGALIVVSHDIDFIKKIEIATFYAIQNNRLTRMSYL